MFHGGLHVVGDPASAAGSADEELHQGQQGGLAVLLVTVDPVVDHNLNINFRICSIIIMKRWDINSTHREVFKIGYSQYENVSSLIVQFSRRFLNN